MIFFANRRPCRIAAGLMLMAAVAARGASQEEVTLYESAGGWGAVSGLPADAVPPDDGWAREGKIWTGRISPDAGELDWGSLVLDVNKVLPAPPPLVRLPLQRNPFGSCLIRSLSVRYNSLVHSRQWSVVFNEEGEGSGFRPLPMPVGPEVRLSMEMEDAVTGTRWKLHPARRGREGGMFSLGKGRARLMAGTEDDGDIEWNLLAVPQENGRLVLQGRVMTLKSETRLVRIRLFVESAAPGMPLLQEECPPAVVGLNDGIALAMLPDLAEPRQSRAVCPDDGRMGIEFDLAVTRETGNFPRTATFSLELDAWECSDEAAAVSGTAGRLAHTTELLPVPESVLQSGLPESAALEPSAQVLTPPGGTRDRTDALSYLLLKTSSLFPDCEWTASAFLCKAMDADGKSCLRLDPAHVFVAVNPDPDLKAALDMGRSRGQMTLVRIQGDSSPAAWIRTAGAVRELDYHPEALKLCDYPAVWENGVFRPCVDLRHAEAELIASLACVLKKEGRCLLVSDSGPLAPWTTYHADALVCESGDPAEMRRQHLLANGRPVLWRPDAVSPETEALAGDFGFVRFPRMKED